MSRRALAGEGVVQVGQKLCCDRESASNREVFSSQCVCKQQEPPHESYRVRQRLSPFITRGGYGSSHHLGDDHGLELGANGEDGFDVRDVIVGDLRDVEEARDASEDDEGALGLDTPDNTSDNLAGVEVAHLGLDDGAAVGDNEAVLGLVDLEKLEGDLLADHLLGEACTGSRV